MALVIMCILTYCTTVYDVHDVCMHCRGDIHARHEMENGSGRPSPSPGLGGCAIIDEWKVENERRVLVGDMARDCEPAGMIVGY